MEERERERREGVRRQKREGRVGWKIKEEEKRQDQREDCKKKQKKKKREKAISATEEREGQVKIEAERNMKAKVGRACPGKKMKTRMGAIAFQAEMFFLEYEGK